LRDAGNERRAHVDAHLGNSLGISAMGCQVLGEGLDGPGILALGHKQHAATNEIDKQAHIVGAAPGRRLIKHQAGDVGVIGTGTSPLDVMVDDPP
jgi:hypothetical protein